ncbi:MAG: AraC family transcriptional regulator [Verrucomicrobia bacterium]|jgi:PAS domain S-box-containing protein|nr:AraC family transcriptional regulator [Verrucomicrobiota bacterium]MBT7067715.1 AraC family transcriptional regulator [Verrucomicrobiota bacterium]MBT7698904.1 AraC family transcriptional regulator [Verrucomicrobiota bacterium]
MDINPQLQAHLPTLTIMQRLFDDVEDIVFFVKDCEGRYILVNRTLVARCGFVRRAEVIGKTAADIYPPPFGKEYLAQDQHVVAADQAIKDKLELQLYAQGVQGWCLTHKSPIHGSDGSVVGMTGLSRDLHIPHARGEELAGMSAVIDHIRTRYAEPLRIEDLAVMATLSPYKLEQRMKRIFQLTAGQFIMHTRIDAARDLLRDSDAAIADIASQCGFYDQSAFTRQFKAITGLTPTDYRRSTAD